MKTILLLVFFVLSVALNAQVAVNTDGSIPDNSAMLDVKSTTKGILVPRVTLAQRNAISAPANGLMIYQTDNTPGFYYNSGSSGTPSWKLVGDNAFSLPYSGTCTSDGSAFTVTSSASASNSSALNGFSYAMSGSCRGLYGHASSDIGIGVMGTAGNSSGFNYGVYGMSNSVTGTGVYGIGWSGSGINYGVQGHTYSPTGYGVYGSADVATGINYGVYGTSHSPDGFGVYGSASSSTGANTGVYGLSNSSNGYGVYGKGSCGVRGSSSVDNGRGVLGIVTSGTGQTVGVFGESASSTGIGVYGNNTASNGSAVGVWGNCVSSEGYSGYFTGGRFFTSSNVGIGTAFPDWQLIVQAPDNGSRPMIVCRNADGDDRVQLRQTSNGSGAFYLYDATNTNTVFLYGNGTSFINGGNLGIGTTSPAYKLQVGVAGDGTQARANAWNLLSDARLKKDFSPIDDPLGKIQKMNGYYYYWNTGTDQSRQVGFSAQEMKDVLPEVVSQGEDGYLSIEYGKMAPLLIEAIKELKAENDKLRKDNENLNQKIADIENKLMPRAEK